MEASPESTNCVTCALLRFDFSSGYWPVRRSVELRHVWHSKFAVDVCGSCLHRNSASEFGLCGVSVERRVGVRLFVHAIHVDFLVRGLDLPAKHETREVLLSLVVHLRNLQE